MLFREYWGRPEATAAAFDAEGFFLTGDTVSLEGNPPYYRVSVPSTCVCIRVSVMCSMPGMNAYLCAWTAGIIPGHDSC